MTTANEIRTTAKSGFTLLELMVVIALMMTIMSILFLTLSASQAVIEDTTVKYDAVEAGMTILDAIGKDIAGSVPPISIESLEDDIENGYIFIIRNHGESDRFDELWLSTTAQRGGMSSATLRNVRYFVYFDKNIRKRVLVRQEFSDMHADPDPVNLPWKVEDEEDAKYMDDDEDDEEDDEEEEEEEEEEKEEYEGDKIYEMFDGIIERFEIQYLDMRFDEQGYACVPRRFTPSIATHPTETENIDFRHTYDIWGESHYDRLNCSSPRAIRIVIYLKDYDGYKSVCFDRVFWIAHTKMPSDKWKNYSSD